MRSLANHRETLTQVSDMRALPLSANSWASRQASQPVETPAGRPYREQLPIDIPSANCNPGVIGASLRRLYDSGGSTGMGPLPLLRSHQRNSLETAPELTESLLD